MTHNVKAIVKSFIKAGEAAQQAAHDLKALYRKRESAQQALIIEFATQYGEELSETSSGTMRWADPKCAAKRAMNRLLVLAYGAKQGAPRASTDPVELLVKRFEELTAAQQRRFKAAI
jgi:hypothetical protein